MARPVLAIALTGGIGSGKSTVAELFARLGATLIDADRIAHALTAAGGAALPAIIAAFGPTALAANGALDRAVMRQIVFGDPSARKRLEGILHPAIRAHMQAELAIAPGPYALLAIPLLFETGQRDLADRVLVVDVPEATQIARVRARDGLIEDEIRRIMACQATRATRLAGADDRIDNSGAPASLVPQVEHLHQRYLALAQAPRQAWSIRNST